MADKEIRQKIVLDGEKEYSNAIKDAQRNLKVLRSELKAETAELGKNATESQKLETKQKSLQKQIEEQEKIVKAYRDALAEVKEKYGDNEAEVAKWETRLNEARATLGNMRSSLSDVGSGFTEVQGDANTAVTATKSFADALQSIASAGDSVSSKIEDIFSGMLGTVKDTISTIWTEVVDLAYRANGMADLAGYWNTDVTKLQAYEHAVKGTANSFEDLQAVVTKLNFGDSKKIATLTGVSDAAYTDKWEYAMAVLDSMSKMDPVKRSEVAGELLGRQGTKMLDLVNDWGKVQAALDEFDVTKGGIGMTEEEINTMAEVAENVSKIEETWRAFKESFTAGAFGKLSLDLTGNFQGALDALIAFFNADTTEEQDAALADFEKNLEAFIERLQRAIETAAGKLNEMGTRMQGSENGLVASLGDLLVNLSDVMGKFADGSFIDAVVHGVEAMAAVWVGGKVLSMVGTVASFAANLKTISGFKMPSFTPTGSPTGSPTTSPTGGGGGDAVTGGGLGALVTKILGSTAAKVAAGATAGIAVLTEGIRKGTGTDNLVQGEDGKWYNEDTGALYEETPLKNVAIAEISDAEKAKLDEKRGYKIVYEEEDELLDDGGMFNVTDEQRDAAEAYWDAMRRNLFLGEDTEDDYMAFRDAFSENEETMTALLSAMEAFYEDPDIELPDDLPDWFFNTEPITGSDIQGLLDLPGEIQAAVENGAASGIRGIQVNLDGEKVGSLVAPYVSSEIARSVYD